MSAYKLHHSYYNYLSLDVDGGWERMRSLRRGQSAGWTTSKDDDGEKPQ